MNGFTHAFAVFGAIALTSLISAIIFGAFLGTAAAVGVAFFKVVLGVL